jgi:hypothetical protein
MRRISVLSTLSRRTDSGGSALRVAPAQLTSWTGVVTCVNQRGSLAGVHRPFLLWPPAYLPSMGLVDLGILDLPPGARGAAGRCGDRARAQVAGLALAHGIAAGPLSTKPPTKLGPAFQCVAAHARPLLSICASLPDAARRDVLRSFDRYRRLPSTLAEYGHLTPAESYADMAARFAEYLASPFRTLGVDPDTLDPAARALVIDSLLRIVDIVTWMATDTTED